MFGKLHRARKTGDWTMIFHFKFEPNHARYAKLSRQQSIIGQLCNLPTNTVRIDKLRLLKAEHCTRIFHIVQLSK